MAIYEKMKILVFGIIMRSIGHARTLGGRLFQGIRVIRPYSRSPNYYIIKGNPSALNMVVDVGCGFDADLSMYMNTKHQVRAVGIDPTLKHKESLSRLSAQSGGKFIYLPAAISDIDGTISFNESVTDVSGSILSDHKNIKDKSTRRYNVESISLANLPARLGLDRIEYIKLDLEGAEYPLIDNLQKNNLDAYDQIFMEFHHHAVPQYSKIDTTERVRKIEGFGFRSFTLNKHDYLFFR